MTGLAISIAIQMAARLSGMPLFHMPRLPDPKPGVNLKLELSKIQGDETDLKLISRTYEPKTIALTFDDGPHPAKTPTLLRMLKKLDVKATFFLVGKMVDKNPWLVRDELAQGHEVGNHTYHHLNLATLLPVQVQLEYRACSDAIQRASGFRPRFCRPPGGRFDTSIIKAAADEGMWTVLWTDDPGDFNKPDPKVLIARIDREMHDGGILLLHDGIQQTLDILPEVIQELRRRGYRFVTCSQLLAQRNRGVVAYGHRIQDGNRPTAPVLRRRAAAEASALRKRIR